MVIQINLDDKIAFINNNTINNITHFYQQDKLIIIGDIEQSAWNFSEDITDDDTINKIKDKYVKFKRKSIFSSKIIRYIPMRTLYEFKDRKVKYVIDGPHTVVYATEIKDNDQFKELDLNDFYKNKE